MRALQVTGVLGLGTALVFALAAATATLFPNGTVVNQSWGGMWRNDVGWDVAVPMPAIEAPMPAIDIDPALVDPGMIVDEKGFDALPGDVVVGDGTLVEEPVLP